MGVRRSFTPEFKAEVVALARRGDRSIAEICRDLDLFDSPFLRSGDPMSRYRFIEAEKHQHAVSLLCCVLEVSRAAYYRWKTSPLLPRAAANLVLVEKIRTAHTLSGGHYGSRASTPNSKTRA